METKATKQRKAKEGHEWKNLEIKSETVKILAIEAIKKGTKFKPYAEEILEKHAQKLAAKESKQTKKG